MTNLTITFSAKKLDEASIKAAVKGLLGTKVEMISDYVLHHLPESHDRRFELSQNTKVNVLANARFNAEATPVSQVISLSSSDHVVPFYKMATSEEVVALTHNGNEIAYYDKKFTAIYMPYDISEQTKDIRTEIYTLVLTAFGEQVLAEMRHPNSWVGNAAILKESLVESLNKDRKRELKETQDRYDRTIEKIKEHQRNLKQEHDKHTRLAKDITRLESDEQTYENYYNGLDQIASHPGVSEVLIENDTIKAFIRDVHAWAKVEGEDKRYYIGNMRIEMNVANSDIKFFGDNPRKSHWTEKDPHPHVNGRNGEACLGNASAMIAELCSQREVYPLFLVCLDFLENANTEDTAGRHIVKWEEAPLEPATSPTATPKKAAAKKVTTSVQEDRPTAEPIAVVAVEQQIAPAQEAQVVGTPDVDTDVSTPSVEPTPAVDPAAHPAPCTCERCGNGLREDEQSSSVHTTITDGRPSTPQEWCERCADQGAYYSATADAYVTQEVYTQIEG